MRTLKQQYKAIRDAEKIARGKWTKETLADASSTIASINMIGEKKILLLPELIEAVRKSFSDNYVEMISGRHEVRLIMKRMGVKIRAK